MPRPVYLAAYGHCSARGLSAANAADAILAGATDCASQEILGTTTPYFRLPLPAAPWQERARNAIAAGVQNLTAVLPENEWRQLPLFFASSSFQIGEFESAGPLHELPAAAGNFAAAVGHWLGLETRPWCFSTACTSALSALAAAQTLIEHGLLRHALVVGCELDNRMTASGFHSLGLLSGTAPRPFAADRDGLVLGEAVAAVLLTGERALAPARPWRLAACELGLDAFSPTGPNPDGSAIASTIAAALERASVTASAVELIKLHAAGAGNTDLAEARALHGLFGPTPPPLLSLKPYLGHTLGASGLAEMTALLACLEHGTIPATPGCTVPDPEIGLQPTRTLLKADPQRLLLNAIGFGGSIAASVLLREQA